MGVTAMSQPSQVLPFNSAGASSWSIGGSANQTNELLVDGVPNVTITAQANRPRLMQFILRMVL